MADLNYSGAAQGALSGAAAGSAVPGIGTGIGAVVGGVAGLFGSGGGEDAAAQQQAQNQAAQLAWNKQQDPFSAGGNREQYVPQLNQLMQGGPAATQFDPMFQKINEQSLGNVQRLNAASGRSGSGAELAQLRDTSFMNQMGFFNQQYERLSQLSGASRGGGAAAIGQSPGAAYEQRMNTYASQGAGFGSLVTGLDSIFGGGSQQQSPQGYQSGGGLWNGPQGTDPATGQP